MPPGARPNFFDAGVKGVRGLVEVEPDGSALIQPEILMETTPSLTQLLRLAVIRLPAEPIGVGAKWTASEPDLRRT